MRRPPLPLILITFVAPLATGVIVFACGSDGAGARVADAGGTPDGFAGPPLSTTGATPYDAGVAPIGPRAPVKAEVVKTAVDVQGMMFSAGEMQISGEPFAQFFAGRNLAYYDRAFVPPDRYLIPAADGGVFDSLFGENVNPVLDLFGFSTAVESYEYSKYHMNSVVEFSGAGISLMNGPLVSTLGEPTSVANLAVRTAQVLVMAGTDQAGYAVLPPPRDNQLNQLGFAGLVPVFAPYSAFEPGVVGTGGAITSVVQSCNRVGGYGGVPSLNNLIPQYECEYNELHVQDSAVSHAIVPAVLGLATWKQSLWAIDFAGRLHDAGSNNVGSVAPADRAMVGTPNNQIQATSPSTAVPGVFLGSTPLEGMWGLMMLVGMDNLAEWLVTAMTTTDGVALSGFASRMDATSYDYSSPLRWFPASVTASVNPNVDSNDPYHSYPALTSLAITDGSSRSIDLAAILVGDAMLFATTDLRNAGIAGTHPGLPVLFDGNHTFPADDGIADGEATLHDRALAVLRVALVDLERIHADPALGIISDSATMSGSTINRSATVSTTSLSHVLIGLRQTLLSVNAAVTQYGSANADPSADAQGILNAIPIHPPNGGSTLFSPHVRELFVKNAAFVRDVLTTPDGRVANAATITSGVALANPGAATLEAQAAAARALTEAFLLTGDETYRTRARLVMQHLIANFWVPDLRMFRGQEGGADQISMTPERYGWLQSALRETHEVLFVAGDPTLGRPALETTIARIGKLYLNGWDDLNGDGSVNAAGGECLGARMQQSEASLTGELGLDSMSGQPTGDRDGDCVTELAHAGSLSVFAGEVTFHR